MSKSNFFIALAILVGSYPLYADEEQKPSTHLEEVVVSGSKLNQTLIETPASVTVLDSIFIKRANITNLRDLDDFAPNVSISQLGQVGTTSVSIRGIQSNPFVVNRVAVYFDGIPFRDPETVRLNNIEQVEIMRGPQSALYGANANAGIIVINSRQPEEDFAGRIGVGYNSFEGRSTREFEGYLEGRFSDALTAGLNFQVEEGDSYVKNIASSISEEGEILDLSLTAKIAYQLSEATRLNLIAVYNDIDAPGLYEQEFPALNRSLYNNSYGAVFNGGREIDEFEIANDAPKDTREKEWVLGVGLSHAFTDFNMDLSASFRRKDDYSFGTDLDLTGTAFSAGFNDTNETFINLEARLSSAEESRLQWLVGINYFEQERDRVLSTLIGPGGLGDFVPAPEQRFESEDVSVFGQLVYPFTERMNLTAGLRVESAKRIIEQDMGSLNLGILGVFGFPEVSESDREEIVIPKVSIDYELDSGVTLYGAIAKGYLPGGYNLVAAGNGTDIAARFGAYDKEELWSYELGAKGYFNDNRVFISTAIFFIDASSWQENRVLTDNNGRVLSTNLITSDASMESFGLEFELVADLTDRLNARLGIGYTDAEYQDYPFTNTQNLAGNDVYLIPEYDLGLNVEYALSDRWYLGARVNGTGKTTLNSEGTAERGIIYTGGFSLGYEDTNWSISAFVENITNKRYAAGQAYLNFLFGNDGNFYAPLAPPRIIGLKMDMSF